jgi:methylthioxylose transferase
VPAPPTTTSAAEAPVVPRADTADTAGAEGRGARAWAALVVVGLAWGAWQVSGSGVSLRAAPLMGRWELHPQVGIVPAVALGAAVIAWGPGVARRAAWPAVPPLTGLVASVWTAALAAADGWSRLTEPLTTRHEYEPLAARVGDLGPFLGGYVDRLGDYPIHVQGHPPGPVVVAWALDRVGLGGAGWLALLAIAAWGGAVAAALVAARAVAGEPWARRAAPALAVLPAAVWAGTSLDALFAGLVAAAVALLACAGRRWAAGGGVVGGVALLCSYGVVPLVAVAAAAIGATARRPWRVAAVAGGGAVVVLALAAAGGFWWPDGLAATRQAYWAGVGADRPGLYLTLVGNPAALALAVGPATAAGLASLVAGRRPRDLANNARAARPGLGKGALLPAAALVAVAAADLSQMSRGEVERIWLPFVPWIALAGPGHRKGWLAAQVGLAVVLQSVLVSPW